MELLRRRGPLSRAELVASSGLSRTRLYDVVAALVADGVLSVSVPRASRRARGRPAEQVAINPTANRVVGIDFGRHVVRVAAVDTACHTVIGTAGEEHGPDASWQGRVETAWRLLARLTGDFARPGALHAVGVGLAGPVRRPGQQGRTGEVAALVSRRFGTTTRLDSHARLAALAESTWGAASGRRDVLYVHLSHSISGGLLVGGTLHYGVHGLSGEVGHIAVSPDGPPCNCGRTGCLQTVAGIPAVLDAYRRAGGTALSLSELSAAANAGDITANSILRDTGRRVGQALATFCHVISPEAIVVGGELLHTGPVLMNAIRHELDASTPCRTLTPISLHPAALGESNGALGAIAQLLPHKPNLPVDVIAVPASRHEPASRMTKPRATVR
ncbi:ROK family protein [Streptomyces sp. WMMC500]|uniref:ROK family protein n=1 Tax=Streptomyces sp. WMMC500 TaxID=3015154 RepID=UPI00248AFB51|nr:ROK family protein [Streptomyces sp. WMMC500]WBB62047.1 ROK family protein [Streptomyces sp. WMMC500]